MSSQPPRTRPPARRVSSGSEGGNDGGSESRGRSGSSGSGGSQPPGPPRPPRRPPADNYAPPPRRDPFPYVLGGIIALLVVGVFAVVYLLSSRTGDISISATPTVVADAGPTSVTGGVVEITAQPGVTTAANDLGSDPQPTAGEPPPRMPLAEFKALYDNPAERAKMLIIDVRAKESFDAGHIEGAESWPEADIDATVVKLPKDKLIVAYCQ